MPELPEVETVRRTLARRVVGGRVEAARVHRRNYITGDAGGRALLVGGRIERIERLGKHLAIVSGDGRAISLHLGMTGGVRVLAPRELPPAHTHVEWEVVAAGGRRLRVVMADARRFGGVWSFPTVESLVRERWVGLGPDALTVTDDDLADRLGRTRRAVKAALLDQRVLAGVGNIYADESLHMAGVHPAHPSDRLCLARACRLAGAIRAVLGRAIEAGGSTVRDYRDAENSAGGFAASHAVYGRAGLPCLRCGRTLAGGGIAGRSTVWCLRCQRGAGVSRDR